MYDTRFGQNWAPTGNAARRIEVYSKSGTILAGLFLIGLILVIVIVLSLIPLYLRGKTTSQGSFIQIANVDVFGYVLTFIHNPINLNITLLANNTFALEAALTSMMQTDSYLAGSVVTLNSSLVNSENSRRRRRFSYDTVSQNTHLVSDLHIMMGGKSCATSTCAQIFHDRVVKTFTSILNKTTPFVHYEENSEIFHFLYILPSTCNSNVSIIYADGSVISSLLARLLAFQQSHSVYSVSTSSTVLRTSVIA